MSTTAVETLVLNDAERARLLSRAWLSMDNPLGVDNSPIVAYDKVPQLASPDMPSMDTDPQNCGPTATFSACQCPTTICGTVQPCVGTRSACGCR